MTEYRKLASKADLALIGLYSGPAGPPGPPGTVAPFLFATLRATVPGGPNSVQFVDGYNTQGDGGGGQFTWDAASIVADNSGTIAKVASIPVGRWVRTYSGGLDPKWFGAYANGVADDTAAIGLCDVAAISLGTHINLTAGTYKITTTITSAIEFGPGGFLLGTYTLNGEVLAGETQHIFAPTSVVTLGPAGAHFWVSWWGATGDGVTNDTTALLAATASYQAALSSGNGAAKFCLASGTYLCGSEIVITNISGGCIEGYGSAKIQETYGLGLQGKRGQLVLVNVDHMLVRNISCSPASSHWGQLSILASIGDSSITVSSYVGSGPPIVGQKCALSNFASSEGSADFLTVKSVVGDVVAFTTTLKHDYAVGDYFIFGVLSSVCNYSDQTIGDAKISSNNRFENVFTGNVAGVQGLMGFANTCKGGGPILLTANVLAGASTVTVSDTGEVFDGEVMFISDNAYTNNVETKTVQSVNTSTNQITFTTPLAFNHVATDLLCYLQSASDVNNEEHAYINCTNTNAMVGGWYFDGVNQLANELIGCSVDGAEYAGIYSYRGGSGNIELFVFGNSAGWDLVVGGPQQHVWTFSDCLTESLAGLIQADSSAGLQFLNINWTDYDKKNGPSSGRMIDVTGYASNLKLDGVNLGKAAAITIYVFDYLAGAFAAAVVPAIVSYHKSSIGAATVHYDGLHVVSLNTIYESNSVSETVLNGDIVKVFDMGGNGTILPGQMRGITNIYSGSSGLLTISSTLTGLALTPVTTPAAPAADNFQFFIDSADGKLKVIGPSGTVTTLANP